MKSFSYFAAGLNGGLAIGAVFLDMQPAFILAVIGMVMWLWSARKAIL